MRGRLNLTTNFFSSPSLNNSEGTAAVNRGAASQTRMNLERGVERAMEGWLWEQLIPSLAVNWANGGREQSTRNCPCSERLDVPRGEKDPGRGGG